jgi:hypothetical protein
MKRRALITLLGGVAAASIMAALGAAHVAA